MVRRIEICSGRREIRGRGGQLSANTKLGYPLTRRAVITDPKNPNFDLEKLLLKVSKENP